MYDKRNCSPIVRGGIIASDPSQDFYFNDILVKHKYPPKLSGFLIDAHGVHGSSGSLVFLKSSSFYDDGNGMVGMGSMKSPAYILGMLKEDFNDINEGLS